MFSRRIPDGSPQRHLISHLALALPLAQVTRHYPKSLHGCARDRGGAAKRAGVNSIGPKYRHAIPPLMQSSVVSLIAHADACIRDHSTRGASTPLGWWPSTDRLICAMSCGNC